MARALGGGNIRNSRVYVCVSFFGNRRDFRKGHHLLLRHAGWAPNFPKRQL
jgi:hypothetical protein